MAWVSHHTGPPGTRKLHFTDPTADTHLRVVSDSTVTTIYGKRYHLEGAIHQKFLMLCPNFLRSNKDKLLTKLSLYYDDLLDSKLDIPASDRPGSQVVHELCVYFNYIVAEHRRHKDLDRWVLHHKE